MERTHGRLRATLVTGKIPVTDEAFTILYAGLTIDRTWLPDRESNQPDGQNRYRAQKRSFPASSGVSDRS